MLIVNNPQFTPIPNEFIKVIATPNNDVGHTFTARISPATLNDFLKQQIEYLGIVTMPVSCQASCGDQRISFTIGGLNFSFTMNFQTIVEGFGNPPMIAENQAVDLIVCFREGTLPNVVEVTNPLPSTVTPTVPKC